MNRSLDGFIQSLKSRIHRSSFPLRLAQEVRIEAHLAGVRLRNVLDPRARATAARLRIVRDAMLHWGCGGRVLPGWINIDGWYTPGIDFVCDLRSPLPFADGACRLIFSEHVLEHIDPQFVPTVLRELRRVLSPAGTLRLVIPDCGKFAQAYSRNDLEWFRAAVPGSDSRANGLNDIFYNHFHRFGYDFDSMAACLREAGFRRVIESVHMGSAVPELRIDQEVPSRIMSNFYLEAGD
jgi:predicted SAM-dependent methyltransferase